MVNSEQQVLLKEEGHDLWRQQRQPIHSAQAPLSGLPRSDIGPCLTHVHLPGVIPPRTRLAA